MASGSPYELSKNLIHGPGEFRGVEFGVFYFLESTYLEPKVMQFVLVIVRSLHDHLLTGEVTALDRFVAGPFLLWNFEIALPGGP